MQSGRFYTVPFRALWTPRALLVATAILVGSAYAFLVLGRRPLNPLDVSWVAYDPAAAYLGWAFFRQENHLALPLGWSSMVGYPFGEPVAYFDCIPLLAAAGWVVRDLLPDRVQYFGLYYLACCVLQFYFGFRISRRLCGGNAFAGALGGGLFLMAPAFTWRALGHFAVASHWIILATLDQLLREDIRLPPYRIGWTGLLCLVAGSINPYIAVMSVLVSSAACARTVVLPRHGIGRAVLGISVSLGAALTGLALFGF